jgi:hypothetical protein
MLKDYTDLVIIVLGSKEYVYSCWHVMNEPKELEEWKRKHPRFVLNRNLAMRLRGWMPWYEFDWKHIYRSLKELFRKKKVGLLLYQEPEVKDARVSSVPQKDEKGTPVPSENS